MVDSRRVVAVRSYRDVVDVVERRIFRIDRWRIPSPGGVSAAAIGYFAAALVAVLVLSRLPLIEQLLGSLQPALRLIGIPVLCAWSLVSWQVDGRRPHHALWAWCRSRLEPRTLSGLGRAPTVGTAFAPVEGVTIAPSGDEPRYRAGRVQGPAIVLLRYPARLAVEGRGVGAAESLAERLVRAKRVRVLALDEAALPLVDAQAIRIPEGAEVVFE